MFQGTTLNQTRIPVKREQVQPGPIVQANGTVQADNIDRIAALEALVVVMQAAIDALELTVADHETRITALEP